MPTRLLVSTQACYLSLFQSEKECSILQAKVSSLMNSLDERTRDCTEKVGKDIFEVTCGGDLTLSCFFATFCPQ